MHIIDWTLLIVFTLALIYLTGLYIRTIIRAISNRFRLAKAKKAAVDYHTKHKGD